MDKYEETATRILEDDDCIHIEGAECFTLDAIKVADILREAFPAQKSVDKPQAEANEELLIRDRLALELANAHRYYYDSKKDFTDVYNAQAEYLLTKSTFRTHLFVCQTSPAEKESINAIRKSHEFLAILMAFMGRDRGTNRQEETLDSIQKEAAELDKTLRAFLSQNIGKDKSNA